MYIEDQFYEDLDFFLKQTKKERDAFSNKMFKYSSRYTGIMALRISMIFGGISKQLQYLIDTLEDNYGKESDQFDAFLSVLEVFLVEKVLPIVEESRIKVVKDEE